MFSTVPGVLPSHPASIAVRMTTGSTHLVSLASLKLVMLNSVAPFVFAVVDDDEVVRSTRGRGLLVLGVDPASSFALGEGFPVGTLDSTLPWHGHVRPPSCRRSQPRWTWSARPAVPAERA